MNSPYSQTSQQSYHHGKQATNLKKTDQSTNNYDSCADAWSVRYLWNINPPVNYTEYISTSKSIGILRKVPRKYVRYCNVDHLRLKPS